MLIFNRHGVYVVCILAIAGLLAFGFGQVRYSDDVFIYASDDANEFKLELLRKIELHLDTVSSISYEGNFSYTSYYEKRLPDKRMQVFAEFNPDNFYGWDTELVEDYWLDDSLYFFHMIHKSPDFFNRFSRDEILVHIPDSYDFIPSGYYGYMWYVFHFELVLNRALGPDSRYVPVDYPSDCEHCVVFGLDTFYERTQNQSNDYIFIDTLLLLPVRTLNLDSSIILNQSQRSDVVYTDFRINQAFPDSILNPGYYINSGFEVRGPEYFANRAVNETEYKPVEPLIVGDLWSIPLTDAAGNEFFLSPNSEEWLLLEFWFLSCYPCMLSLNQLNEIQSDDRFANLKIVGLNGVDKGLDHLSKIPERGINIPVYNIPPAYLKQWGISGHPRFFLINPQQEVVAQYTGFHADLDSMLLHYMGN